MQEPSFITITTNNLDEEHLCCALADKKHQHGVNHKKQWLRQRLAEGHVLRKLDVKGKIFVEYAPLETAWTPVDGENFLYIYCLWVAGSFKGKGYGKALLDYCLADDRAQNRSGVCVLSAQKKKPYLSDKTFFLKHGFMTVDTLPNGYELLALSFDGTLPSFRETARAMAIDAKELTIYYSAQCPFTADCIQQIQNYCQREQLPLQLVVVDTLAKAKNVPAIFNNWAVFYQGQFQTTQLLNENGLIKLLASFQKMSIKGDDK